MSNNNPCPKPIGPGADAPPLINLNGPVNVDFTQEKDRKIELACLAGVTIGICYEGSDATPMVQVGWISPDGVTVNAGPPPGAVTLGQCPVPERRLRANFARLDGLTPGAATSSFDATNPTIGNTFTIPAGAASIFWTFNREQPQDPGDGSVARLAVNAAGYFPGSGPQYQEVGKNFDTTNGEVIDNPFVFVATGSAKVEIWWMEIV